MQYQRLIRACRTRLGRSLQVSRLRQCRTGANCQLATSSRRRRGGETPVSSTQDVCKSANQNGGPLVIGRKTHWRADAQPIERKTACDGAVSGHVSCEPDAMRMHSACRFGLPRRPNKSQTRAKQERPGGSVLDRRSSLPSTAVPIWKSLARIRQLY